MRKCVVLFALALFIVWAVPAWAGDLKNEDSQSHNIKKIEGASSTSTQISGNTTLYSICSDCTIELVDSGQKMDLGSSETIVIKGGAMSK